MYTEDLTTSVEHRTIWIETGTTNMREHDAANTVS